MASLKMVRCTWLVDISTALMSACLQHDINMDELFNLDCMRLLPSCIACASHGRNPSMRMVGVQPEMQQTPSNNNRARGRKQCCVLVPAGWRGCLRTCSHCNGLGHHLMCVRVCVQAPPFPMSHCAPTSTATQPAAGVLT
jgi:hypothetical protein